MTLIRFFFTSNSKTETYKILSIGIYPALSRRAMTSFIHPLFIPLFPCNRNSLFDVRVLQYNWVGLFAKCQNQAYYFSIIHFAELSILCQNKCDECWFGWLVFIGSAILFCQRSDLHAVMQHLGRLLVVSQRIRYSNQSYQLNSC